MRILCVYFFSIIFFLSCKQNNKEVKCEQQFNRAKNYLSEYYLTNNKDCLYSSILTLDSIECDTLKYKISAVRIPLYLLTVEYEKGIIYVESLDENKFLKPYHKKMYLNNFKALKCKENNDTICKNAHYNEIANEIYSYLQNNTDFETLFDLYIIKSKIEKKERLFHELDSIKKTDIYDNDLLDALCNSLEEIYELQNEPDLPSPFPFSVI